MDAKSIFASKTFWLNVIGAVTVVVTALPEKYSVPAMALLNIVNRLFTDQPVTLFRS